MESQVGVVLDIDRAPIASGGAGSGKRAGADTPASQWAVAFMRILYEVIVPGDHAMAGPAERVPLFAESNVIRGIIRRLCAAIDIMENMQRNLLLMIWKAISAAEEVGMEHGRIVYNLMHTVQIKSNCTHPHKMLE